MNKLKIVTVSCLLATSLVSCNEKPKSQTEQNGDVTEVSTAKPETAQVDNDKVFEAAMAGDVQAVKYALSNGFEPNAVDENSRTALMLASFDGHSEIVKLLIEHGADVNLTDVVDRTALMYASTGPFESTVLALLQAGARPNMIDKEENWTAAMMAAAEGQLEVLKTLVSFGADLKMVDVDGESSLDFANARGHGAVAEYIRLQLK